MRVRAIEVDIKVEHEDGTTTQIPVKTSYQEPESLSEIKDLQMSEDDKLRAFQYGLYNIRAGKLRSENNLGGLAKKLVENKIFGSTKEALEFLVSRRAA